RTTHVFFNLDADFSVAERRHRRLAELHAEIGADLMSEGEIRVARENHQFSAHRSLDSFPVPGTEVLTRTWFVSTAGVGGRRLEPATLICCALLRKPTKRLNCNGNQGSLSTECDDAGQVIRTS